MTGASDGIGAEYCRQLAQHGFNIVLVARTLSKLEAVERELKQLAPSVRTKLIVIDLSTAGSIDHYRTILDQTAALDVSLVIPNAGVYKRGQFDQLGADEVQTILDMNMYHVISVVKLFYQRMLDRTLQSPGTHSGFVFVSSVVAKLPLGYGTTHHASKAWVDYVARGLKLELLRVDKPWGKMVDIQNVLPSLTVS